MHCRVVPGVELMLSARVLGGRSLRLWIAASLLLSANSHIAAADNGAIVRIGGTGIALAAMRQVADSLTGIDPAVQVQVLPSLGTPGGIRALLAGAVDIALAARPLTPQEAAKGAREAVCFSTALIFASSHPKPTNLTRSALPRIYADPASKWADGTPLNVIMRSRSGSENPYLVKQVPEMAEALDQAYARGGTPVGSTDQENADLVLRIPGSLGIMTLLQVRTEKLDVRVVPFEDVIASPATLENGSYPFSLRVCAVTLARQSAETAKFLAHFQSAQGKTLLHGWGSTWAK
jgi:phosphate transport system substrate-binding protein